VRDDFGGVKERREHVSVDRFGGTSGGDRGLPGRTARVEIGERFFVPAKPGGDGAALLVRVGWLLTLRSGLLAGLSGVARPTGIPMVGAVWSPSLDPC